MASPTEDPDLISVVCGAFTQSLLVVLVQDGHVHTNVLELASDGFPCCIWFAYACLCDVFDRFETVSHKATLCARLSQTFRRCAPREKTKKTM